MLDILDFWFGTLDSEGKAPKDKQKRWWTKSVEFDILCRQTFAAKLEEVKSGLVDTKDFSAKELLAYIVLCDQIPRNSFREKPESFAYDGFALKACTQLIESGFENELVPTELGFGYMPLMHSEEKAVQEMSIEKFTELKEKGYDTLNFAIRHKAIIDRFGRYPHRNAIVGRNSTPEEIDFLKEPGSSF